MCATGGQEPGIPTLLARLHHINVVEPEPNVTGFPFPAPSASQAMKLWMRPCARIDPSSTRKGALFFFFFAPRNAAGEPACCLQCCTRQLRRGHDDETLSSYYAATLFHSGGQLLSEAFSIGDDDSSRHFPKQHAWSLAIVSLQWNLLCQFNIELYDRST